MPDQDDLIVADLLPLSLRGHFPPDAPTPEPPNGWLKDVQFITNYRDRNCRIVLVFSKTTFSAFHTEEREQDMGLFTLAEAETIRMAWENALSRVRLRSHAR